MLIALLLRILGRFHWSTLDIFSCLLGSRFAVGRDFLERIIYLNLVVLSLCISNGLVNVACEFQLQKVRQTVDSWDDVLKLNLTIDYDENLAKKVLVVVGEEYFASRLSRYDRNCLKKLYLRNDRVCPSVEKDMNVLQAIPRKKRF